jgi:uncharacterized protein YdaU (DUF1376 family)
MSQAPALPMFVDAMLGDTLDLSAEAFGAYHLLLYAIWRRNGEPLPDDDAKLARICRVTTAKWKRVLRPELVGFFDEEALERTGTWRQKRLEKEWNFVAKNRQNQATKGKASARARALKNNETGSTAVQSRLQPDGNRASTPIPNRENIPTTRESHDSARDPTAVGGGQGQQDQDRSHDDERIAERVLDALGIDHNADHRWLPHLATMAATRMRLTGATEAEIVQAANEAKAATIDRDKPAPGPGYVEKIAARLVAERATGRPASGTAAPAGEILTEERPYLRLWKASKAHRTEIDRRASLGDDEALDRWAEAELRNLNREGSGDDNG